MKLLFDENDPKFIKKRQIFTYKIIDYSIGNIKLSENYKNELVKSITKLMNSNVSTLCINNNEIPKYMELAKATMREAGQKATFDDLCKLNYEKTEKFILQIYYDCVLSRAIVGKHRFLANQKGCRY